jgi:hypothetical protein
MPRKRLTTAERIAAIDAKIVKAEDRVLDLKTKRAELIEREKAKAAKMEAKAAAIKAEIPK